MNRSNNKKSLIDHIIAGLQALIVTAFFISIMMLSEKVSANEVEYHRANETKISSLYDGNVCKIGRPGFYLNPTLGFEDLMLTIPGFGRTSNPWDPAINGWLVELAGYSKAYVQVFKDELIIHMDDKEYICLSPQD